MTDLGTIAESARQCLSPGGLLLMALGTSLGIIVGAIPGLTGAMLIALALPLTFGMNAVDAMILLVSMYVGSISGGLISATLLRMPGTPASMMTTLDGYPMAKAGRAGRALGLGVGASFVGGLISWLFLASLSLPVAALSTKLGPFEMFALTVTALALIASASGGSVVKAMLSGALGMLAAMPGMSPATGELRLTFGIAELDAGFRLLPVLIGLFAVSQAVQEILRSEEPVASEPPQRGGMFLTLRDWRRHGVNLIRSSLIGAWVGILPGVGANIGSLAAYTAARGLSSNPDEFGYGSEEGVIASEAANNATVGGALIPLVAMGIPGSVIDAILLGALVIHGLQPGPLLFSQNPDVVYTIMGTALLANIFMFVFMMMTARHLAKLMRLPRGLLVPAVLVFCVIGSYALNNRFFDVWVMLGFGVVGLTMEALTIPLAPFVIGFVLAPMAEEKLSEGLMQSGGAYWPLITRPMSLTFLLIALAVVSSPIWVERIRRKRSSKSRPQEPSKN